MLSARIGKVSEGFSAAERSLHPRECGACHPEQHRQWQGSLHAGAYSPGLAGQLVEGRLSEAPRLRIGAWACCCLAALNNFTPAAARRPAG